MLLKVDVIWGLYLQTFVLSEVDFVVPFESTDDAE